MMKTSLCVACVTILLSLSLRGDAGPNADEAFVIEALPDWAQARLDARTRRFEVALAAGTRRASTARAYVLQRQALWGPGANIKVAFQGGSNALRRQIADVANRWERDTRHRANFTFDWGIDPITGAFREWTRNDVVYAASIRVSFDASGYWSSVGTDSVDPGMMKPGEASLNLQGFDQMIPENWEAVVLHEFGHAIGFEHEHQNPSGVCESQFRFEDDPGYVATTDNRGQFMEDDQKRRPGIYCWLGGPPNNWPPEKVDDNMRKLSSASHMYMIGPYDSKSIMEYSFPGWMCKAKGSKCCVPENRELSKGDLMGVRRAYPDVRIEKEAFLKEQLRVLETIEAAPGLDVSDKAHAQELRKGVAASLQRQ